MTLSELIDMAIPVGRQVRKVSGYPFPGEVRAAFVNRAGDLRYVVEATGPDYAGMLHIFSPAQIELLTAKIARDGQE